MPKVEVVRVDDFVYRVAFQTEDNWIAAYLCPTQDNVHGCFIP